MRIAFLDPSGWDYTVDTPLERPFGGSQSAMCYLAIELPRLGHSVAIYNGIEVPTTIRGVEIRKLREIVSPGHLNGFDSVVVLNSAVGSHLRRELRLSSPLILWMQHAHDQPAASELKRLNERKAWTGFAFVSNWQRECYEKAFWIDRDKCRVLRNAVTPALAEIAETVPWFVSGEAPVLFYSSTPFRGLDVLLDAFPDIQEAISGVWLRVYSSMSPYQVRPEDDGHRALYQRCQSLSGVDYVGSVGQARLATELVGMAALAYPSTFAETSCIAVLEAMAVGAAVVTTRLGALPETTNGLASMIDSQADKTELARSFATKTIETLREAQRDAQRATTERERRRTYILDNYSWSARASEWIDWLTHLRGRSHGL